MTDEPTTNHSVGPIALRENEMLVLESLGVALQSAGLTVGLLSRDSDHFFAGVRGLSPDVAILSLRWDGARSHNLEVLEELHRSLPTVKALVLSTGANPEFVERCYAAGASAFVYREDVRLAELTNAVRLVARGERLFPAASVRNHAMPVVPPALTNLSQRESEVLRFVSGGADNLKISAFLGITERTVKAHLASLYRKLGCDNRTQLALKARELGVTPAREA